MNKEDEFLGPSFGLKNKVGRVLWGFVAFLFFKFTPRPFHAWRRFVLRLFGAKIGKKARVYPKVNIWAPWNLDLKDECIVANGVTLYCQGKITIGYRTVVSQGTHLVAGSHDYTKQSFPLYTKPIHIGSHVWIAAEVFVHPGIIINEGCVIGARSVVNKNMPEWMVCAGFPCVPIKKRILRGVSESE